MSNFYLQSPATVPLIPLGPPRALATMHMLHLRITRDELREILKQAAADPQGVIDIDLRCQGWIE